MTGQDARLSGRWEQPQDAAQDTPRKGRAAGEDNLSGQDWPRDAPTEREGETLQVRSIN